ncbi:MAG: DsbA family oxidoreductase [Elusimicrobia bacterium]|nr:MAG: DsbA family oxidoreductase [Elusimicrobiota bacterium]
MVIGIWSDVLCPFCYIGKRELEGALEEFEHRDKVRVEWRSFELDPHATKGGEQDTYAMLVERYGISHEEAVQRVQGVVQRAASVGLTFRMDLAKPTNSFDAHRLLQLAKQQGLGDAMKERLLHAYFTEGLHIADHEVLQKLAAEVGLEATMVTALLSSDHLADEVRNDELEARRYGVQGVPFFVLDERLAVRGAQARSTFLAALRQAWDTRD